MRLPNKVSIVTGAGAGMGYAAAPGASRVGRIAIRLDNGIMRASSLPARAAAVSLLSVTPLPGCGDGPASPTPIVERFSGAIDDAPPVDAPGDSYALAIRGRGTLAATLSWLDVPPAQPLGRAWLRLVVRDDRGQVTLDSVDLPLRNPLTISTAVGAGSYRLTVSVQPRDRVAFFCLCRVPYSLSVTHP